MNRKTDHKYRLMKIRAIKEYAKEASEMTREELELAYIKVRFAHVSFSRVPRWWLEKYEGLIND